MCGIAGLFEARSTTEAFGSRADVLRQMAKVQTHRGPDDEGFWHDDSGRCSLAQRRLSIIDTSSAGHQPMLDASGRWVITFNGEIYNYLELRAQLEAAGATFRGRTDTEVLLNALALWGIDALPRLDGMFAFAAFDRASGQLILARDPFGEKPLYYAEMPGGGLAFASELQAIECVPGVGLAVSPDAVAELLMFQYIGAPRTIYTGVRKLPPGHWLIAYPEQAPRVGRYFEFRPGSAGFDRRPLPELADELEDILVRSLRRRLISDVPLGAFLSGGVDSSTVCALIRRRIGVPLKTFSIGFEGAPESEHETARKFAHVLGTEHHEQIIAPNASEFLLGIGKVLDEPNADSSCLPTYLLSRFARESVTVALSGDGGDEMFAGYGRYFATLDDERRHRSDQHWRAGTAYYSNRILVSVEQHVEELLGGVPESARAQLESLRAEVDRQRPLFCALRATDVANYMPGAVLPKVDRMSMQHSLEVRTPFLNVELARFAERMPTEALYERGVGKRVLREIAYRHLPRDLIDLPKQGFGLPMSKWARDSLLDVCAKLVEEKDSRLASALGADAIGRFMKRQRSDGGFATYQVWALAMLESWLRHHPAKATRASFAEATSLTAIESLPVESHAQPASSAFVPSLTLWRVAKDLLVVLEDTQRLDLPTMKVDASGSLSRIVHLMQACGVSGDPDFSEPPLHVASWNELASRRCPREIRRAMAGATLICPQISPAEAFGRKELERLRAHGVARLAAMHPHRGDSAVFMLDLRPAGAWKDFVNARQLSRVALGREQLSMAGPRSGHMCVAGPLPGVPADETEMSDRFLLFDGLRQLPPIPALHVDIQQRGEGRYSIWGRHAYFSRLDGTRGRVWAVALDDKVRPLLPYAPRIVAAPSTDTFLTDLDRFVRLHASSVAPSRLKAGDRITVLTHALPPGGAERQWCYLALELKRRGFDVSFVTVFPLDGQNCHYLPMLQSAAVPVYRVDEQTPIDALKGLPTDPERRALAVTPANPFGGRLAELTALLAKLRPQAVLAQLDYSNLIAGVASLLVDVPQVVLSFRNYNPTNFSYLTNDWFLPLYQALSSSPRVVLSGNSSAASADYARWIGVPEERVHLIPNAIDSRWFQPSSSDRLQKLRDTLRIGADTPVVLGVFRLNEEKRPLLFVESCAQIAARFGNVRFLVAGVGPFESAMRRRIEELDLMQKFHLLGRRDDVPDLMAISSLLLLTSSFEGMPNVVMEAQLSGLPVVASRVGGVADCMIDAETGYIVELDDYEGFAERCVRILSDPALRKRLGEHAAEYMRDQFSPTAMADRYVHLLSEDTATAANAAPRTIEAMTA